MDRKWSGEVGQREKGYSECYRGKDSFGKEDKSFLRYVFKDISFPPECDDRIKIKTLSSIISPPSTQIIFCFSLYTT